MAQIRNTSLTLTLGGNITEFDFVMFNGIDEMDFQMKPRIETYDFVVPVEGDPFRYKFDTTLLRWDTTLTTFDYE